jgi:hypothetical protein
MFQPQPDRPLPADLVMDDATAYRHALALQPTVGPSAAPATVTAHVRGQGLFIRVVVDENLPASERDRLGELARARVVGLLRTGTGGGGWTWDAAAGQWTSAVRLPDEVRAPVPDHVPEEWTRAA